MSSTARKPRPQLAAPAPQQVSALHSASSQQPLPADLSTHPAPQPTARQLQAVAAAPARRSSALWLAAAGMIGCFLMAQITVSNMNSEGAYELTELKTQLVNANRVERILQQNTMALTSPQNLADNAKSLGMVENNAPAYLRLSDGVILGAAGAATGQRPVDNLVPNATLQSLPVINESGQNVNRDSAAASAGNAAPLRWEGELPAPQTR